MRRKRKGVTKLIMAVLIIGIMGLCVSCIQNTDSGIGESFIHESEALGFSLELPQNWKDKYVIEETDNEFSVFSKKVYEEYNSTGRLFTIVRVVGELITEEDMKQEPAPQQIVLKENGYTYFMRRPSDVQYPADDEELSNDYTAMYEQISEIVQSISILGDQKPKAANEGFKVAGTSFFTVEIPNDWELKALEESSLRWNLYSTGDNKVGEIELIPYRSEGLREEGAADDNMMREYLFNDEIFREIKIILDSEFADQDTMGKLKNSLKFSYGPFTVVDLQNNAERYIAGGGRKVFGTIEDVEMENGRPVAVRVNVMEFLTDNPEDEYPNGFRIVDLYRIETYSLDFGVNVAPLVAPNYNTYGIYEMPLLDENFLKNYENYKERFYDFIIGRDEQLKIVIERYIP